MEESVSSNKKIKAEYCIPKDRFAEILEHVFERAKELKRWKKEYAALLVNRPEKPENKFLFSDQEKENLAIDQDGISLLGQSSFIEEISKKEERAWCVSVLLSQVFMSVNKDVCINVMQANRFLEYVLPRSNRGLSYGKVDRIIKEIYPQYVAMTNSFRNECRHCLNEDCKLRGEACPELEESHGQKELQS